MKKQSIPLKYGIVTGIILIVYFLLLAVAGLNSNPVFSFLNAAITAVGIYLSIKSFRRYKGKKFKYQKGFMAGILTGFYATIIFTVFFGIYFSNDTAFAQELLGNVVIETNAGLLILAVALMGFASTLVVTLALMQLFKDSWNTKDGNRHTYSENKNFPDKKNTKKNQSSVKSPVEPNAKTNEKTEK